MNKRYCNRCGFGNPWELVKPKVCKCGNNMDAAFATVVAAPVQAPAPTYTQPAPTVYARPNRPVRRPADETFEGEESDYLDRDQAHYEAQQLAASIRGQIKVTLDEKPKSIRFGDLENIQRAMKESAADAAPKAKRSRRK